MKKIIMLTILAMTLVGCELLSPTRWAEYEKDRDARGRECYRTSSGYFYCEDTKQGKYELKK